MMYRRDIIAEVAPTYIPTDFYCWTATNICAIESIIIYMHTRAINIKFLDLSDLDE